MITAHRAAAFLRERLIFAKLAAIILWVCYVGSILLGDGHGTFNLKGELCCADHLAFYTAARLIREGRPEMIYEYDKFIPEYQNKLIPMGRWTSLEAFRNPPFYALLYYPTAFWPFQISAWFWAAVSIAALAVGVWLLLLPSPRWGEGPGVRGEPASIREAQPLTPNPSLQRREGDQTEPPSYPRSLFWVASLYPTFCAVSYGQNTLLSFLVFAITYRLLAANRPFAAGLVAGLLWFKPPLLLGLGLWGLLDVRRKWPCAVGVVVTGAVLTLATYPFLPVAWQGFAGTLTRNVGFENFEQWKMHNPLAFWRLLLPADPGPDADLDLKRWHVRLSAVCSLAAVAVFVWLWQKRKNDLPVMFGAAVFVTLLASPHALIYEWALLGITAVLWWPATRRDPDRWFLVYGTAWVVLFISTHFAELQLKFLPAAAQVSVPFLGWAFWWSARQLRRSADPLAATPTVVGSYGPPPLAPAAEPAPAP